MAKERIFNLPETKGQFELRGIVNGTEKDNFFKSGKSKNQKEYRKVNFGIEYEKDKNWYIELNGMPQEKVYFSKPSEKKGEKGVTKAVEWADRFTFDDSVWSLIGKQIGIRKVERDGKQVNDTKRFTDFDACKHINENLEDEMSVYVRGTIDYSHYQDDKGNTRRKEAFILDRMYLASNDIDLEVENYESTHGFNQRIVFVGIEQEKENEKPTGRAVAQAKIIKYSSIEDAEFIIEDKALAQLFKKNLKPYTAIDVWGYLVATQLVEEVTTEDAWGSANTMKKVGNPYKRELIITGADPKSIDKEVYSKDKIDEALAAIERAKNAQDDFGNSSKNEWGSPMSTNLVSPDDGADEVDWDDWD